MNHVFFDFDFIALIRDTPPPSALSMLRCPSILVTFEYDQDRLSGKTESEIDLYPCPGRDFDGLRRVI